MMSEVSALFCRRHSAIQGAADTAGPGEYKMTILPPGKERYQLELAPSGHLVTRVALLRVCADQRAEQQ